MPVTPKDNPYAPPPEDRTRGQLTDRQEARQILRDFGWNDVGIEMIFSLGAGGVEKVLENPLTFSAPPTQYQAPQSSYADALTTYGFEEDMRPVGAARPTTAMYTGSTRYAPTTAVPGSWSPTDYRTNETGALYFNNGAIANPESGEVFFPPNDPSVAGSPAWLRKIQDEWSQETINTWRQRLRQYGYDVAKEGGFDQVLRDQLAEYHRVRYVNYGKPLPYDQAADLGLAEDVVLPDKSSVHNAVRSHFQRVFGDEPTDEELDEWSGFVMKQARRLQRRKGYTADYAAMAAEERFIERFETDPQVQYVMEQEEENTELSDSLTAISQAIDAL
jgi:hypothetical protein